LFCGERMDIVTLGDTRLRKTSILVSDFDQGLRDFVRPCSVPCGTARE